MIKKNKDSLEQLYTYDINNYVKYNYKKDKYTYVKNKEIDFPILNTDNISNEEIQIIINKLNSQFSNNKLINLISNELVNFGKKIDIRKGIIEEESDILNPKLFINQSFDDITKLVIKNKKEFFELISEQFENATSIDQETKKVKLKF